jgi:hypothetical protein
MAVKGAPLSSAFIEAKRRPLTATAAEDTRVSASGRPFRLDPLLSIGSPSGNFRLLYSNLHAELFLLAACFQMVPKQ